jgi:hypothetical protein
MKKCVSVLILLALASSCAFAQFSLEGGVGIAPKYGSDYEVDLQKAIVLPVIGMTYVMPNFDIMAGLELDLRQTAFEPKETAAGVKYSYWDASVGIYGGIAPKFALSDKLTFSLPILAKLTFGGTSTYDYPGDRWVSGTTDAGNSTFSITLAAGGRTSFAFNGNWSFFTGFLVEVISLETEAVNAWVGPQVSNGTKVYSNTTNFRTFPKVSFPVGISYRF